MPSCQCVTTAAERSHLVSCFLRFKEKKEDAATYLSAFEAPTGLSPRRLFFSNFLLAQILEVPHRVALDCPVSTRRQSSNKPVFQQLAHRLVDLVLPAKEILYHIHEKQTPHLKIGLHLKNKTKTRFTYTILHIF